MKADVVEATMLGLKTGTCFDDSSNVCVCRVAFKSGEHGTLSCARVTRRNAKNQSYVFSLIRYGREYYQYYTDDENIFKSLMFHDVELEEDSFRIGARRNFRYLKWCIMKSRSHGYNYSGRGV